MIPSRKRKDGATTAAVVSAGDGWHMASGSPADRSSPTSMMHMNDIAEIAEFPAPVDGPPVEPAAVAEREPKALAVSDLSQRYGAIVALDRVSLSVAPGEIVAVVGRSGSGKSTLLRVIAGLERPFAGRVAIGGRAVCGPSAFVPPEARGVGMMFQDYALFPHLTVLRNVMFGLRGLAAREARRVAERALERIGLAERGSDYPHRLSGGEQQRVALARALVPRPSLMLMDEPFSNLDQRTGGAVRDETVAVLRESDATALIVTHDHEDAMRIGDRIVLMNAGRIVQAGTPEELYRRPGSLLAARFFSEFNEIHGICRDGVVRTPIGDFAAAGLAAGERAIVCIRPAGLRLGTGSTGRVVQRRFLGDSELVQVAVDGLAEPISVKAAPSAAPEPGRPVAVEIGDAGVLVFSAE